MSDEGIVTVTSEEIKGVLDDATILPPVRVVGALVTTGINPNLVHEEEVCTVELIAITPSPDGDKFAIFTLIIDPELAEEMGLQDSPEEEEEDN